MKRLQAGYGLDQDGYLLSEVSLDKIAKDYIPCIRESIEKLVSLFPHQCHSIYVYGSVARGDAVIEKSDLDLLVIFNKPLSSDEVTELKTLSNSLSQKYQALVRDVGIAYGDCDYVFDPVNYYEQAFLQALCVCVHGEDIREHFGPYKLTSEIAISFNGDISKVLARTISRLEAASKAEIKTIVQNFSRKLIRTYYSMVMTRSQIWTTRLQEQSEVFIHFFPEKEPIIRTLHSWIDDPPTNKEQVLELFQKEGNWLAENFESEALIQYSN